MGGGVIISPEIDSILRWAATVAAGYLVTIAHLDPTSAATISGVIIGLATIGWSIWQKRATQQATVTHVLDAAMNGQVPTEVKVAATTAQLATIRAAGK